MGGSSPSDDERQQPLQNRSWYFGACFRLVAAAELWQACDRRFRYQTLSRCLTGGPLYASNRELAGRSVPDNLNGSFRKLRTGGDDPERSFTNIGIQQLPEGVSLE